MLGLPGGPPSASSGRGGDAVALLAAVTAAGNVEFVTLQRGAVCPLMGTVSVSLGKFCSKLTHPFLSAVSASVSRRHTFGVLLLAVLTCQHRCNSSNEA